MGKLIKGKQLTNNTVNVVKLTNSGATQGYVATYESGNDQILWQDLSTLGVTSLTAQNGVSANTSTGSVTIQARTDNQSIFIDGSQNISLGDTNGNIGGAPSGTYTFSDSIHIQGNLTVDGTATTVNTETVLVADNFMTLNSNFTAGTPTQNAGIQVSRGASANAFLIWDETNDWWAISNPDNLGGTGTTYPILTTASVSGASNISVSVVGGDELQIEVVEENLSNIPNSALTNSSITVTAGEGLGGGGTVALGGTVVLSANTDGTTITSTGDQLNVLKVPNALTFGSGISGTSATFDGSSAVTIQFDSSVDTYVTGGTYNSGTTSIDFVGTGSQWSNFSVDLSNIDVNDTFSTGGTISYVNEAGTITIVGNDGFTQYTITGITDVQTTGGTHSNGTITFTQNDGTTYQVTGLDSTDTYVTGGTITTTPSANSESGVITLAYNNDEGGGPYTLPFQDTFVSGGTVSYNNEAGTLTLNQNDSSTVTITGFTDVQTTGGTYAAGTITFTQNDGTTYQVTGLDSTDSFSTGGTISYVNEAGTITINGNDGFTQYTITGITDVQTTGGTYSLGTITFTQNDGTTYQVTGLDSTDTYATGTTNAVAATSSSNVQSFDLTGNNAFTPFTISLTDTFVTGGTVSNGSLSLDLNSGSASVTGTIIQSVTGNSPIDASTSNGAVTLSLDYNSLQQAVPTTDNKSQFMSGVLSGGTTGNSSDTEITISNTPDRDGYVKVEVNGVGYEVLGTTAGDSYFSSDACSTAVAISGITSGNTWCWNGTNVGFELDSDDRIDFFYNILQ